MTYWFRVKYFFCWITEAHLLSSLVLSDSPEERFHIVTCVSLFEKFWLLTCYTVTHSCTWRVSKTLIAFAKIIIILWLLANYNWITCERPKNNRVAYCQLTVRNKSGGNKKETRAGLKPQISVWLLIFCEENQIKMNC